MDEHTLFVTRIADIPVTPTQQFDKVHLLLSEFQAYELISRLALALMKAHSDDRSVRFVISFSGSGYEGNATIEPLDARIAIQV